MVRRARRKEARLAGLRWLIVVAVAAVSAWLLVADAGPAVARAVAAVLPAALVAVCGTWACLFSFHKTRTSTHRWRRAAPDALAAATMIAAVAVTVDQALLRAQPAAGLLFPLLPGAPSSSGAR